MVLNEGKTHLNLMKISLEIMMKIGTQNTSLKLILSILSSYTIPKVICHYQKMKNNRCVIYRNMSNTKKL